MSDIEKIIKLINEFRDERNWRQFHNAKDLALSISIESSELLELFQWKNSEEVLTSDMKRIKEELADVLIYTLMLSDDLNLQIDEIIEKKLATNRRNYPIKKSKNNAKKYNEFT